MTDQIEKSDEFIPEVRVFDLSGLRSYSVRALVANSVLELSGLHSDYCRLECNNPVPVVSGKRNVGYATVFTDDGQRIVADVYLHRDCPERLDLENGERKLVVKPGTGADLVREGLVLTIYRLDLLEVQNPGPKDAVLGEPVL